MPCLARRCLLACGLALMLNAAALAQSPPTPPPAPPPAGPLALSAKQLEDVIGGWNVTDDLIDAEVAGDNGVAVGVIDNVYVVPTTGVAYAIIDASRLVGRPGHLIAVPVSRLVAREEGYRLPEASKETIAALSVFTYPE